VCMAFTLLLLLQGPAALLSLAAGRPSAAVVAQVLIWSAVWGRMAPLAGRLGPSPILRPGRAPLAFIRGRMLTSSDFGGVRRAIR